MKRQLMVGFSLIIAIGVYFFFFNDRGYHWALPDDIPPPIVPTNNPITAAKVELGRHLFYDKRLSANRSTACATCHIQTKGFTDGKAFSSGLFGDLTTRNSMNLTNVAYNQNFTWANPLNTRLEHQARLPLFGEMPPEMGLTGSEPNVIEQLKNDETYQQLFKGAFSAQHDPFNFVNIINAIASFERSILSFDSPYDKYLRGEIDAISAAQKRGMQLFFSERTECFHCHGGFNFSDSSVHKNATQTAEHFHNNGLYNVDGKGAYPKSDRGLFDMTSHQGDMGKFKAPTLRNIAVTAPFMHDGSIATLEGVLTHYINGGTDIRQGENKGFGSLSPFKSEFIPGLQLSEVEQTDLLSFLHSLTDQTFLTNPDLSDPFKATNKMATSPKPLTD
jgi:cytochrome c peroxidase